MKKRMNWLYILSLCTSIITLIVSLAGLFIEQIYLSRVNKITAYELMGQDTITAFIVFIFIMVILFMDITKVKTKIILLGCLMYIFYTYAYYSFGCISSVLYIIYILLTGLSLYLFIFTLIDILKTDNLPTITNNYPRKSLSAFFLFCILLVTIMELREIIAKTVINKEAINPFFVFYVLDLSIIFPAIVIVSIYNFRQSRWGYLLSGVALIKVSTILPAVVMNDLFHWIFTGSFIDFPFDIMAIVITITALAFLFYYMKTTNNAETLSNY